MTARSLAAKRWVVDCPHCLKRQPARLELSTWVNAYIPARPRNEFNTPMPRGYCATCNAVTPDPIKIRAYTHIGKPAEKCGPKCLHAQGDSCNCECLGACHGIGTCAGHELQSEKIPGDPVDDPDGTLLTNLLEDSITAELTRRIR